MVAVGGALELPDADDLDAILPHKSPDTALSDMNAQPIQFLGHPWSAIAAQAQAVLITDMGDGHDIALAMGRGPMLPSMEPAL